MAASKSCSVSSLLLLLLVVASAAVRIEGRRLQKHKHFVAGRGLMHGGNKMVEAPAEEAVKGKASALLGKEDARPTAPGHSPGAGHSLNNKGIDKNY